LSAAIIPRVFALVLAAALSGPPLFGAPAAAGDTLANLRARGELSWGGDIQGGEPYVFEDPKDPKRLIGFEVEIADALAGRLGVRARFSQADWSNLVPALERGDFDIAMNGIEDTPARRARILTSVPYFVFGETLAVQKGASARTLGALRGQRVATLNQSYALDLLKQSGVEVVLYEGVSEPYTDLELGRVTGVLLDHIIADRYGCSRPRVECLSADIARGTYIIAMRRPDVQLKAAIDAALLGMIRDGELRRILERWKLWDRRQEELESLQREHEKPKTDGGREVEPRASASGPGASAASQPRGWTFSQVLLFLDGAAVTLGLSVASFALALPLGLALALARLERRTLLRWIATVYIEVLRGTPLLLQLYVLYFALAPVVRLGPITAAILGLGLNYAAYEAEIQRGALLALPPGQAEAARALGLTRWQALRYVLLPQSFRVALPSMTNDFVALLKDSSLVSVITVVELTKRMTIAAVDLRGWLVPGLACAALYFAMSYPLARLAQRLERTLGRDQHPQPT
jgi:polar amino acid transport system substrate-binding protein